MEKPTTLSPSQQRIQSLDAIRGFALMGIVIVHMLEQYMASPLPPSGTEKLGLTIADQIVNGMANFLIRGKFFALFSVLFGVSFFLQMDRSQQKGESFEWRFIWKMILLFGIGYVHQLFYQGDILTIYAFTGLCLLPFFRWPNRVLLVVAVLILFGLARYLVFGFYGLESIFGASITEPGSPALQTYFDTLKSGSLWAVFSHNATEGMLAKLEFQFGIFGRAYLTLAYFILGLWLGRIGVFQNLTAFRKNIRQTMLWSLLAMVGLAVISAGVGAMSGGDFQFESLLGMFFITVGDLFNTLLLMLIGGGFLWRMVINPNGRFFKWLAVYGRTALTNYVFQSIIGTFLLFGWGLGLIGEITYTQSLAIAFGIIVLQVAVSVVWMTYFKYGPLEWLWRIATYGRWFSIKK